MILTGSFGQTSFETVSNNNFLSAHPIIGHRAVFAANLRDYFVAYYLPNNIAIPIVSDFDPSLLGARSYSCRGTQAV